MQQQGTSALPTACSAEATSSLSLPSTLPRSSLVVGLLQVMKKRRGR